MKRKGKQRIPWQDIKRDYIQGFTEDGKRIYPTQRELEKKYNVDARQIANHSIKENWVEERQQVISKIAAASEKKVVNSIATQSAQFNIDCFNTARAAMALLVTTLKNGFIKKVKGPKGTVIEIIVSDLSPNESKSITAALRDVQAVGKIALGEGSGEEGKAPNELEDYRKLLDGLSDKDIAKLEESARILAEASEPKPAPGA